MRFPERWIWLDPEKYPDRQTTNYDGFSDFSKGNYSVVDFKKEYTFGKKVNAVHLRFSADTEFTLYLNDKLVATGPVTVEGDFLGTEKPRCNHYATETILYPDSKSLNFFARVKMMPVKMCEFSKGHGGFMLSGYVMCEGGERICISTGEDWLCRLNKAFVAPYVYDERKGADEFMPACYLDNLWKATTAPLRIREEKEIFPIGEKSFTVPASSECEKEFELDMIYAGFLNLDIKCRGLVNVDVFCRETDEQGSCEKITTDKDLSYRSLQLHSAGKLVVSVKNESGHEASVTPSFITTFYPVDKCAVTRTSDDELNKVLDVCAHTLKYCRQLHHLDSPRHCEPLACTGDYYIESLMTSMSYGDMTLSEFDVLRTAELLRNNDGRMFHTTYSLIWVRMLYDVFLITGNKSLLYECEDALLLLLSRFESYIGENGIIENPPDYMFVDWIYIDGLSMHHPPKALGQTCLNMFYYGALKYAGMIFNELGNKPMTRRCTVKHRELMSNINSTLYDAEKKMYFEGLNTPTPEHLLDTYMPQNVEKRYYLKHSNILAACFGVYPEDSKDLIEKIMTNEIEGDVQPYFCHYLLEAIYKNDLRDKYTLSVLEGWKKPLRDCPKGLVEGFVAPEPTYPFDHSHAWGGTPLYSLPKAITGIEMVEAGYKKIKLSPSTLGLEYAHAEIPTPYGNIVCDVDNYKVSIITPKEITIVKD